MSIDTKEFEKHKDPFKYILDFLRENAQRAYTAEFIAKEIGLDPIEVTMYLQYDRLAELLDKTYRSPIDRATVKGVTYYKYKGV